MNRQPSGQLVLARPVAVLPLTAAAADFPAARVLVSHKLHYGGRQTARRGSAATTSAFVRRQRCNKFAPIARAGCWIRNRLRGSQRGGAIGRLEPRGSARVSLVAPLWRPRLGLVDAQTASAVRDGLVYTPLDDESAMPARARRRAAAC
jgi:hypothetical protein